MKKQAKNNKPTKNQKKIPENTKPFSTYTIILIILAVVIAIEGLVFGLILVQRNRNNAENQSNGAVPLIVQVNRELDHKFVAQSLLDITFGEYTLTETPARMNTAYKTLDSFQLLYPNADEAMWVMFKDALHEYVLSRQNSPSEAAKIAQQVACETFGAKETQFSFNAGMYAIRATCNKNDIQTLTNQYKTGESDIIGLPTQIDFSDGTSEHGAAYISFFDDIAYITIYFGNDIIEKSELETVKVWLVTPGNPLQAIAYFSADIDFSLNDVEQNIVKLFPRDYD